MVLTDERWAALAPLLEACRPKGKTPPRDLRRTVEAIVWRHANGAKWRGEPARARPRREVAGDHGRARLLVAGGRALRRLVRARGVEAAARSGAGARGRARHGVPR